MGIFDIILVNPIINVLVGLYNLLFLLQMPFALGFAIILLTVVIRIILYPLTHSQLKVSKKMQELAPHISRVKDKHKKDAKMQQQAMMQLYKEHGVNPAAGCLPTIIQLPVIWALYSVLNKIVNLQPNLVVGEVNKLVYFDFLKLKTAWDPGFFGIPLGQTPSNLISTIGPVVLIVPILTGVFQFVQSKMITSKAQPIKDDKGKPKETDFATAFQTQSLYIFPAMIGFFSYTFPIGLSLYWNTFTIFGILQQYKIYGWGGIEGWIAKIRKPKK